MSVSDQTLREVLRLIEDLEPVSITELAAASGHTVDRFVNAIRDHLEPAGCVVSRNRPSTGKGGRPVAEWTTTGVRLLPMPHDPSGGGPPPPRGPRVVRVAIPSFGRVMW